MIGFIVQVFLNLLTKIGDPDLKNWERSFNRDQAN